MNNRHIVSYLTQTLTNSLKTKYSSLYPSMQSLSHTIRGNAQLF